MTVLNHVENCACDSCSIVGLCLPVADGVYCADCYQAAQDAITDEMDDYTDKFDNDFNEMAQDWNNYYESYDRDFGIDG